MTFLVIRATTATFLGALFIAPVVTDILSQRRERNKKMTYLIEGDELEAKLPVDQIIVVNPRFPLFLV